MYTLLPGTRHLYHLAVTPCSSILYLLGAALVLGAMLLLGTWMTLPTVCRNVGHVHLIAGLWGQAAKDYMSKECACQRLQDGVRPAALMQIANL